MIEHVIDPLFLCEKESFSRGNSTVDQVTLMIRKIEDCFRQIRGPVLCLSTSVACDTVWHPQVFGVCFLTDTWSNSLWILSRTVVLPPPPVTKRKVDLGAKKRRLSGIRLRCPPL